MHKVLVANRGAIARRVIRACNELGLQSVAVYSDADSDAPYLEEASEAIALPGTAAVDTYLNQQALTQALQSTGADALHPGYGFLAENAAFAQSLVDQDIRFIGPKPKWLERMGDKVSARTLFSEHGFPVFPGTGLVVDDAQQKANEIGYPILVKPSGGGGGMGMEVVHDDAQLQIAIDRSRAIASGAFGNSGVYLEKFIQSPRHIEFQILGSLDGNAMHVYERECSVQRRNQKLIEESPAPGIDAEHVARIAAQAAQVCAQLGYDNVGTLETLFDASGEVGFLEMNTRIQVEHGVTEEVAGIDLVQQQFKLAMGESLPVVGERDGYAIEARIYAEDSQTLLPSTGRLSVFRPPRMFGVRVETGYQLGQQVTPYYDAMLAKVIAKGSTREMAIGRLIVALKGFEIQGVTTNQNLLLRVLQDEEFLAGRVHTGILNRMNTDR